MEREAWFDEARIDEKVHWQFVCSHLTPQQIESLDKPLAFGGGLTDCTYWDWLERRARRLFLLLVDLGVPDQIFRFVDDSWEDDDLPVSLDQIQRFALTANRDPKLEKQFFHRQFFYIVRPLQQGQHIDYEDDEYVPLDVIERRQGLGNLGHVVDKVELPNFPGQDFCRRRIPLGHDEGCLTYEHLMLEVRSAKEVQNEHMASYWASYTHQGYAHIISTPVCEYKLSTYLTSTPSTLKGLHKTVRRHMVLDWIHCLVDTLCFIHSRGRSLGNIRPSTILFTQSNHIFYSDASRLNPEAHPGRNTSFDKESYDYAAPEQWIRPSRSRSMTSSLRPTTGRPQTSSASEPGSSFSISRGPDHHHHSNHQLSSPRQAPPSPHINPQALDIFSLGCVILETLSHGLLKRTPSAFASHRSAKHKSAGRGGAPPDASFHRNLGQIETWMSSIAKDAGKKADREPMFKGVAPLLHVVEKMLASQPADRPSALQVQSWVYRILTETSGITEPHCVHQYGGWDFNFGTEPETSTRSPSAQLPDDDDDDIFDETVTMNSSSAPSTAISSQRSSLFGRIGKRGNSSHKRNKSNESSTSKTSSSQWELGSGLRAIQNLKIISKTSRTQESLVSSGS